MTVSRGGAAFWALAALLATSASGCASRPQTAEGCAVQLRVAALGVADAPVVLDCRYPPPPAFDGTIAPSSEPDPARPPGPPQVDPKLFVPSG